MKLITKKSKAILSTCIAISIAGGAVFANVTNEANGTIRKLQVEFEQT